MECEKVKELLPFIDDGYIDQDVINDVNDHLEVCDGCRREYDEIKQTLNIIRSTFIHYKSQSSIDLSGVVQEKIGARKRARKAYKWAFSAAAVVIFAVFLSMYSLLTKDIVNPDSNQIVMAEADEEFYNYIAEHYLDMYELYELTGEVTDIDEYYPEDALLQYYYLDVTVEDVVETLDADGINYLLDEMWRVGK